jgi:hypothetical protein
MKTQHRHLRFRALIVAFSLGSLLGLLAAPGCGDMEGSSPDVFEYDPCDEAMGTRIVRGDWRLTGRGTRRACEDPLLNGSFEFIPLSLTVAQDGEALRLAPPVVIPDGEFELRQGRVRGSCIDFQLVEIDATGGITEYTFTGNVLTSGRIVGEFAGTGPGACQTTGHFAVSLSD